MTPLAILGLVVIGLYAFFAMFRVTFALIERRFEQLDESESRNAGTPLAEERGD